MLFHILRLFVKTPLIFSDNLSFPEIINLPTEDICMCNAEVSLLPEQRLWGNWETNLQQRAPNILIFAPISVRELIYSNLRPVKDRKKENCLRGHDNSISF